MATTVSRCTSSPRNNRRHPPPRPLPIVPFPGAAAGGRSSIKESEVRARQQHDRVPTTFRAKLFSGLTGTKRRRRQTRQTPLPASAPPQGSASQPLPDSHPTGWTLSGPWQLFSKTHGPNVIRRFPAQTLQLCAFISIEHRASIASRGRSVPGAPNDPALVHRHRSRPPHAPPAGQSRSPGGQPAPGTPGCTSYACPTYGQPSRRTSSPTSQVSTIRGQPQ